MPAAILVVAIQALAPIPPAGAAATYSRVLTLPTPPATSFAGSTGGDGWDIALRNGRVYSIFHHQELKLACLKQVDATACWTPRTIQDGTGRKFIASNHSGTDLNQTTGRIYTYAARNDGVGGVLCLDPTKPDQVPAANPYCDTDGFVELTAPGEAQYNANGPGAPMLVGDRYYAYNFNTGTDGAKNKLLCYDFSTASACPGQPYTVDFANAAGVQALPGSVRRPHAAIDGKIFLTNGNSSGGTTRIACFDPATNTTCAGSWPKAASYTGGEITAGPPFPVLNSSGTVVGMCVPGASLCFAMNGATIPKPPGIPATMGGHYGTGGAVTVAARVFTAGKANGADLNRIDCYDYSAAAGAGAVCAGFPKVLVNASQPYTVNQDPDRPTCIWVNSDSGTSQIQAFDAFSGAACGQGGIRVLVSQFVVDKADCYPTEYQSLELQAPNSSAYTSASLEIQTANGQPTGIPNQNFAAGVVNLSGLGLENQPALPQFLVTLTGATGPTGEVTMKLNWNANFDPSCSAPGIEVQIEPTSLSPSITGDGATGTTVTVRAGKVANANTTLAGENAAGASGSVTYTWYSDDACTSVASQGSAKPITTNGVLPGSEPVSLAIGTYYLVASYSGDAGNQASASTCGAAVLTVAPVPALTVLPAPCPIYDSTATTPLSPGTPRTVAVSGLCGVPAGASAAVLTVTALNPSGAGNLRLSAADVVPEGGVVNYVNNGLSNSNTVTVALSPAGEVDVAANGAGSDVRLAVVGYSSLAGTLKFVPLIPCAVADSRNAEGGTGIFAGPFAAGSTYPDVDLVGTFNADGLNNQGGGQTDCGVPVDAEAVVVNVVSAGGTGGTGGLAVGIGGTEPIEKTTNYAPIGLNNAAVTYVLVNPAGKVAVNITGSGSTHVRLVVLGYLDDNSGSAGFDYTPANPCAIFDTRPGEGATDGFLGKRDGGSTTTYQVTGTPPLAQGGVASGCGVPAGAKAVLINLVAIDGQNAGNLRGYATGTAPTGGVLNFAQLAPAFNNSNAVVVPLSTAGQLDVFVNTAVPTYPGAVDIRGVVLGYYD